MNRLYYGDNLDVMREHLADESVDLVYLDPPFNSKAQYNLLFKTPAGEAAEAQAEAFQDTWTWTEFAAAAYDEVITGRSPAAGILRALRSFLGESDMMAYIAMMSARLIELHRVLKPTGSLYLHCDPTASHYLKIVLDGIFGAGGFRNEIIWKRTTTHSDSKTWSRVADHILFFTKSDDFIWNTPRAAHSEEYKNSKYRHDDGDGRGLFRLDNMTSPNPRPNMMYEWKGFPYPQKGWRYSTDTMRRLDEEGRVWYPTHADGSYDTSKRPQLKRYLSESPGGVMGTVWTDINPINSQARERLGYPTQKPLSLMERIIEASSNPGDLVLDPFCGCGSTVHAAESFGRRWAGIDVTHYAVTLVENRVQAAFPEAEFEVYGRPLDLESARDLARRDKYQFQWWANWRVGVQNYREHKKGADRGIDGIIYFRNGPYGTGQTLVSVKAGDNVGVGMIRDFRGTLEREDAELGLFVTLAPPTQNMRAEAASAGFVKTAQGRFPRIQISTVEDMLRGIKPELPQPYEVLPTERHGRRKVVAKADDQLAFTFSIQGTKKGGKARAGEVIYLDPRAMPADTAG